MQYNKTVILFTVFVCYNVSGDGKLKKILEVKNLKKYYGSHGNITKAVDGISFDVLEGKFVAIMGASGSGKTTLLRLITGSLAPTQGSLIQAEGLTYVYLDQEYSTIRNDLSVLEQLALFNSELYDNELRTILNRFLFPVSTWNKKCSYLSGGEKMKLSLCCLMVSAQAPDVFIVDEPTNNIDILSMEILTETLKDYQGTLLVVSHDNYFVQQIKADKQIELF